MAKVLQVKVGIRWKQEDQLGGEGCFLMAYRGSGGWPYAACEGGQAGMAISSRFASVYIGSAFISP